MKLKVTQIRSVIGRKEDQKRTIVALGLGKINRTKIHDDNLVIRGMVFKVAHLVKVEEIKEEKKAIKKPAVKKTVEKKDTTKKAAAKKTTVKKVTAKKPDEKKATVKKAAPKKTTTKKAAPKKTEAKKAEK